MPVMTRLQSYTHMWSFLNVYSLRLTALSLVCPSSCPTGNKSDVAFVVDNEENQKRNQQGHRNAFCDDCGAWQDGSVVKAYILRSSINALPDAVKHFVVSKQPTSAEQTADLADLCFELSRIGNHQNGYGANAMAGTSEGCGYSRPPGPVPTQVAGGTNPSRLKGPGVRADADAPQTRGRFGPPFANVRAFAGNHFDNRNRPAYYANAKRKKCRERYRDDSVISQDEYKRNCDDKSIMYDLESLYDDGEMIEPNNCDESYVDECMSDESGVCHVDIIFSVIVNETSTVGLRDSGNMSMLIVDESLVSKSEINYDEHRLCSDVM